MASVKCVDLCLTTENVKTEYSLRDHPGWVEQGRGGEGEWGQEVALEGHRTLLPLSQAR